MYLFFLRNTPLKVNLNENYELLFVQRLHMLTFQSLLYRPSPTIDGFFMMILAFQRVRNNTDFMKQLCI